MRKPGTNLHLFLSPILNETRLVKEARATLEMRIFQRVMVIGLWEPGLQRFEMDASGLEIWRAKTILRVIRGYWPSLGRNLATRILGVIGLLQYACAAAWAALTQRPSHVSCHNAFLLPLAWITAHVASAELVYLPHELEVERTGLTLPMKRVVAWIEKVFVKRCSAVVVVCEPIASWYEERYGIAEVHVIRAIPELKREADPSARERIRAKHEVPESALLFIYQGVLAKERGVDDLMHAFLALDDRYHLMLMGYGEAVDRIKRASSDCRRIHFQPAVPVPEIIDYSSAADVGVFVIRDPLTLSYQLCLPNKFFEYLCAGLPVIVSTNLRLLTQMVIDHEIGWSIRAEELAEHVRGIDASDVNRRRAPVAAFVNRNTWDVERLRYKKVYPRC